MIKSLQLADCTININVPDICPNCGIGIVPNILSWNKATETGEIGIIFECPACKRIAFSTFVIPRSKNTSWTGINSDYEIETIRIAVYPLLINSPPIPKDIKEYFPDFYEIYTQADIAEQCNLHKIIGMAYRKALELLVKGYLVMNNPSDEENILAESLGKSIARIPYPKIQALAKAASWIGNDETHTVKKNPDWKVEHMKKFILSLCNLILAEKASDEAINMINSCS